MSTKPSSPAKNKVVNKQYISVGYSVKNEDELHVTATKGNKTLTTLLKIIDKEILSYTNDLVCFPLEEFQFGLMPFSEKSLKALVENAYEQSVAQVLYSRYRNELIEKIGEKRAKLYLS